MVPFLLGQHQVGPCLPTGCRHSPPHPGSLDTLPLVSPAPTPVQPTRWAPCGPYAPHSSVSHTQPFQSRGSFKSGFATMQLRTRECVNRCQHSSDPLRVQGASVPPHSCEWAGAAWVVCRVRRACPYMLKPRQRSVLPFLLHSRPFYAVPTLNSTLWPPFAECD